MLSRRSVLALSAALPVRADRQPPMALAIHQTTSVAAGFRASLEGYARAGIRYVEVIPPLAEEFIKRESAPAARRLITDLGLKAVSSGGTRGLVEPNPGRARALEELKRISELAASLGIDRVVCPCGATDKFTADDYARGVQNLRDAGDVVQPFGVTAMLEFMRGSTFVGALPTSLKMTRQAAHPNVRSMLDCYHFWAGLSKFEDLDLIRDGEIHHVHFQDVPEMARELLDNSTREIPGLGVSPLVRILRKLAEKKYRGPLSVEVFYPRYQQSDPYQLALLIRRKAEPILQQAGVL
ncbi:MAG TPA: sugar phosphate isomerase/epimerase [Bryobacteraceae bacterium]|nr:sugar phosphate isomerase/epimerase [Bryobacteraceae bacterium]